MSHAGTVDITPPPKKSLTERIEDRLDLAVIAGTEVDVKLGIIKLDDMPKIIELARLMSVSGVAVPYHLRNNVGACLAIYMKALHIQMEAYDLAQHSYSVVGVRKGKRIKPGSDAGGRAPLLEDFSEPVETMAFDSTVFAAVLNAHAPIVGRLEYEWDGEGDNLVCTVKAKLRATGEVISMRTAPLKEAKEGRRSPLWNSKPRQQLGYEARRDFARLYFPEVMMGWHFKDEIEEAAAAVAFDVTPTKGAQPESGLKQRLRNRGDKEKKRGFSEAGVHNALEHKPGETLPDALTTGERRERVTIDAETRDGVIDLKTNQEISAQPPPSASSGAAQPGSSEPAVGGAGSAVQHQEHTGERSSEEDAPGDTGGAAEDGAPVAPAGASSDLPTLTPEEIVEEVEAKKRAIANVETEDDAYAMISDITALLRENGRNDLLGDFLASANARLKKLSKGKR